MGDPPWINEGIGIEKWSYIQSRIGEEVWKQPWRTAGVSARDYYRVLKNLDELRKTEEDHERFRNRRR